MICYNRFHLLTRMGYLVSGKREKHWEIYDDGNLLLSGTYKHDKKNGPWEEYYVSGKELFRGKYKNDLSEGKWKVYLGEADLRGEKNNVPRYLSEIRRYKKGKLISKKTYNSKGELLNTEKW